MLERIRAARVNFNEVASLTDWIRFLECGPALATVAEEPTGIGMHKINSQAPTKSS
jgi:hypothetical protein